jgi:hypothetical protein
VNTELKIKRKRKACGMVAILTESEDESY